MTRGLVVFQIDCGLHSVECVWRLIECCCVQLSCQPNGR